ncbi:transporter substrate-binding domain-containing protein [Terasakiella sp. SH-1]|uniref:substrate-binding periplasmic protein n=1 Tax=Terasakiella sp. SH-1 TaxID=2560057 RepID=UPI00142FE51C|nr:transporter substrate-binding domain-containing protein [Terasakiella sp. SH-1]
MLRKRYPLILLLVGVLMYNPLYAEEKIRPIKLAAPTLHKLAHVDEKGALAGAVLAVIATIEQATTQRVDGSVLPFPRIIAMLKAGEIDLGIFIENPERDKIAHRLQRIYQTNFVLVRPKNSSIKGIDDLAGKTVGISRVGVSKELTGKISKSNILQFSSHRPLMSSLLVGKIDAFFTPDFRFVELIEEGTITYDDFDVSLFAGDRYLALYAAPRFKAEQPEVFQAIQNIEELKLENFGSAILKEHYSFK